MMEEYFMIFKYKPEFQKMLNQWKHKFHFEIIWMEMERISSGEIYYHALIKRWKEA